jgi:hypothetical protein
LEHDLDCKGFSIFASPYKNGTRSFKTARMAVPTYREVDALFDWLETAQMAELVDALVSGTSVLSDVQVRVLFWALHLKAFLVKYIRAAFFLLPIKKNQNRARSLSR